MSPTHEWVPLLEGALAAEALRAVDEIAAALRERQLGSPGLAGGSAGIALFFSYLAEQTRRDCHQDTAERFLDHALAAAGEQSLSPSLYGGFTGIAWTLQHLRGRGGLPRASEEEDALDSLDTLETIDEALASWLSNTPWTDDYDLISGICGVALYSIDRLPRASARGCLSLALERISELAERLPENQWRWRTAPELMIASTRLAYPQGYHDLGVAHGMAALIPVAAAARAHGVAPDAATAILEGALGRLRSQARTGSDALFGYNEEHRADSPGSRLAWCYGDAGVGGALIAAGRAARDGRLVDWGTMVLRRAAARSEASSQVIDDGLCHGTVGLAHVFGRAFHATADPVFREAAIRWFEVSLAHRGGPGIAGFRSFNPVAVEGYTAALGATGCAGPPIADWIEDPGLLTGVAGVGLALLAATTPIEPAWDRALLCSI